ncbi:hypothetical protein [Kribbella sindirgiensis]|uniref:Uncharacterized protein n=1 Tax=Kribbella sindirgiensis TaxID=1124744 RepID=A0A4R0I494_9ACTN|nr:hypothetical protein [Kribbella sindirgiensis]TCC24387.1 hypothetical protein E0H50_32620 [Kribbella sindirgiensis]
MTEPPEQGSGSTVLVVTAMRLSKTARAELSELLGPGYTVVDMRSAPSTANIVLAPVSSPMAVAILRGEFPQARILFTELQDDERGINLAGPLSRIVAQAPDGYFVAQSLDALGPVIQSEARLQLAGSTGRTPLTLSLTTGLPLPQQAPDQHPLDETEVAGSPVQEATDTVAATTVRWVDRASGSAPPGRWLDLEPIDALVARLVGTDEPRQDVLWAALTAECVVRLADDLPEDLLVDIAGLEPTIRAELQIRIASEQIPQTTWP